MEPYRWWVGSFAWLVEMVPMVLRGGGGPSRGVEIVPLVLRVGGCFAKNLRNGGIVQSLAPFELHHPP